MRRAGRFYYFFLFSNCSRCSFLLSSRSSSPCSLPNILALGNKAYLSSDSNTKIPIIHSFFQPTVFAAIKPSPPPLASQDHPPKNEQLDNSELERELETALADNRVNDAWKAFKFMRTNGAFPNKKLLNTLVNELTSTKDLYSLKRAFATVFLLLEKHQQHLLETGSIASLVSTLERANMTVPASTLIKAMLKNHCYPHLSLWSPVVENMSRVEGTALRALEIFMEICHVGREVKDSALVANMKPDTRAFNAALNACLSLGSVARAEGILKMLHAAGLRANGRSFGLLARVYAKSGIKEKILKLDEVMDQYKVFPDGEFYGSLVTGYLSLGDLESASEVVLLMLKRACQKYDNTVEQDRLETVDECFGPKAAVFPDGQIYNMLVKGFLDVRTIKDLARFVIRAQEIEQQLVPTDQTAGAYVINACVSLGCLDKAHSILDEMNTQGAKVGFGVYFSLLKAYCKEQQTTEATQLVSDLNMAGLELDASSYDAVVDVCMTAQDFKAAFALFRDMREAGVASLKTSYLTIMTGLTENHRPELMAAFLDEVVLDPRIEVGVHDWNSIIHSFCKLGRVEDARRTFKRMVFLRFEPNVQSYLSLVHGYCAAEKYFSILLLWKEMRTRTARALEKGIEAFKIDQDLLDAFLYSLVKGGFFDAAMEVVEKMKELKVFVDKWRYKQVYMETHKKLNLSKLKKRNFRKVQAIIAFKSWLGLSS